ncbi:MAG: alpha/beta hydrolase [Lactobacillales bacterium]|nr:alpha/beta hydrolase [Lactobacillales bacterium]
MFNYQDIKINYIRYGKGKDTIVLLHGWGQNIEMMKMVADPFESDYDIVIIDLPGHGNSEEPKTVYSLYDFVDCVKQLLDSLKIKNPILIGHSFGGKISLLYASMYDVKKLILFGSPFKREIQKLSLKTKMLKTAKKIPGINKLEGFAKKHIGSTDYKNASPLMRQILVEHVNLDITEEVKKIKCPTLILWGTLDDAVPLERAYELENLISDAGVVVYEGCTHYAYLERLGQTINVLKSFLG